LTVTDSLIEEIFNDRLTVVVLFSDTSTCPTTTVVKPVIDAVT
jgi:hypothetical protein